MRAADNTASLPACLPAFRLRNPSARAAV